MRGKVFRVVSWALVLAFVLAAPLSCGHKGNPSAITAGAHRDAPASGPKTAPSTNRTISLSDVLREIDAYPTPKGVSAQTWTVLTGELKKLLIARSKDGKTLSVAPTGASNAVRNLAAVPNGAGTQATLTWTEILGGDCNNDGQVDIGDLQPIAAHYSETSTGPGSPAYLADANGDGQVDITDLQPIAANYSMHIEGYEVWRGAFNGTTIDWDVTIRPNTNPANPNWSADRTSSPPAADRPSYTFLDDISGLADKTNVRYKVCAFGDGAEGVEGNEATMPQPFIALAASPWPKWHRNAQNAALSPYLAAQTNSVRWTFATGGAVEGSPAIGADGSVYVGSNDNSLYALSPSGAKMWQYTTGGPVHTCPAIGADGTVYFGSDDHNVYALNPTNGTKKWQAATGGEVRSSPAIGADGTIYVGSDQMYALNPADGSVKWSNATAAPGSSPAIGADGTVYIGSGSDLYALNPISGATNWQSLNTSFGGSSPAVGADGTIYSVMAGGVVAINPGGTNKWQFPDASIFSSPSIGPDGTVFFGDNPGCVNALNPLDGSVKWQYSTGNSVESSPAIGSDGTVYVGNDTGTVYAISPVTHTPKWTFLTGGPVKSSPAIAADGTVYVGSDDGKVCAFGGGGSSKYSVSGTVTETGVGLAGATMTLSPGGLNALTQADGTYKITGVLNGSYTLKPSKSGFGFTPPSRSVNVSNLDVVGQNFVATLIVAATPWPKFHQNAQNTGLSPFAGAQTNGVKWTYTTGGSVKSSPAIAADGTVYVGSDDKNLYAIRPAGTLKWSYTTGGQVEGSPAIGADGTIYVGSDDDKVYAINPASPTPPKWSFVTGGLVRSSPTIGADGTIYVGSDDNKLYALDPNTHTAKWMYTTGGAVRSSAAIAADGTIYVGSDDGNLYALNSDGTKKWQYGTGWPAKSAAVGADGTVYVEAFGVVALNPDGTVKWSYPSVSTSCSPAIGADGTVYFCDNAGGIYALYSFGSLEWQYATVGSVESSPAIGVDGTTYVGNHNSTVYAISPATHTPTWTFLTGGSVEGSPAIAADGTVYVGSDDGKVYAFGP